MAESSNSIACFDVPLAHGITLACRRNRTVQGPRVLMLHGFPEAAFAWDEQMRALEGRARCVAPNLRGYAGSSAPSAVEAYRPRHLVADIVALIEALGGPVDLLVAHDWGGALAWNLAAQHPQLLKRLVIINSPHPAAFLRELRDSPQQQAASAYMVELCAPDAEAVLSANDFAAIFDKLTRTASGPRPPAAWLTPGVRERYREVWRQGLSGPLNYYRASPLRPATGASDTLSTLQFADEAVTVRVPTTVLWGDDDAALLPGLLDGLQRWVPDLTVHRVAEASHWIVHERPDWVAAHLARALD